MKKILLCVLTCALFFASCKKEASSLRSATENNASAVRVVLNMNNRDLFLYFGGEKLKINSLVFTSKTSFQPSQERVVINESSVIRLADYGTKYSDTLYALYKGVDSVILTRNDTAFARLSPSNDFLNPTTQKLTRIDLR